MTLVISSLFWKIKNDALDSEVSMNNIFYLGYTLLQVFVINITSRSSLSLLIFFLIELN